MPSRTLHRSRGRGAVLNPYVVVADVAISLLMIVITYFLMTARVAEAAYAADERAYRAVSGRMPGVSESCRLITRNGPFLMYDFPNARIFSDSSHVSPAGVQAMAGMAAVLQDRQCASTLKDVRLTVSYPAEWNVTTAQQNADALVHLLHVAGVRCPIVTSARSQRDPNIDVHQKQELSETEFGIELNTP